MRVNYLYLLFLLYAFLIILAIVSPVKASVVELSVGLIFIILVFICFAVGFLIFDRKQMRGSNIMFKHIAIQPLAYLWLSVLAAGLSVFSIKFYTGLSIAELFLGFGTQSSNYLNYQQYFSINIADIGMIGRLPGIMGLFLLKFILLLLVIDLIVFQKKVSLVAILATVLTICSYLMFSVARGTSLELFEVVLICLFCLFMRLESPLHKILRVKHFVGLLIGCGLVMLVFIIHLEQRFLGEDINTCLASSMCLDDNSVLFNLSSYFSVVLVSLSAYFTFPIYYLSAWIESVFVSDINTFLSLLTPLSLVFYNEAAASLCLGQIDCGASWTPMVIDVFLKIGLFGTLAVVFTFGCLASRLLSSQRQLNHIEVVCLYGIILFMFSLVTNDFVFSISSNFIIFVFSLFYVLFSRFLAHMKV